MVGTLALTWYKTAPSNIALIKYMGKLNTSSNLPTNASLSYTLAHLTTAVKLSLSNNAADHWQPFEGDENFQLNAGSQQRFLAHLAMLKKQYQFTGSFLVQSRNNFPLGCGLASSASSFAALTACALSALTELTQQKAATIQQQAQLSRLGSGSSCRSFYQPWCLWQQEQVEPLTLPYQKLIHQVVIISDVEKTISSSQAHKMVLSSPAFEGRIERVEHRLNALIQALQQENWSEAFQYVWDEFIDMHQLFQTAADPFDYMTKPCRNLLKQLQDFWMLHGNGPLVTMDAGPNIHLLYRPQDVELKQKFEHQYLEGKFHVL